MTYSSDNQSQEKYNAGEKERGGNQYNQCSIPSSQQFGVLLPNPTLGDTNFGGVSPNMPYGPVYAFPAFPFQHGINQGHNGGQWQQGGSWMNQC